MLEVPVSLRTRLLEPVEVLNRICKEGIIRPSEVELTDMKRDFVEFARAMKQNAAIRLIHLLNEKD